ncbi:MAG: Uma2 family endonuclease [Acidobacteria bacterium]|nr:Uma2 family endonuclease [Acidobacteriota bacterium]
MSTRTEATIEDLYSVPENGKAELVNGEIVQMPPTGGLSGRAGGKIYRSLDDYERETKSGYAFPDNVGFVVNLSHRKSFSPDAAFYIGELKGGDFLEGAPVFAVEVRSKNDYGEKSERALERKRADYFTCGTLVVWDVDVLREKLVRVYRATDPDNPTIYRAGDVAEAEPAVPSWTILVDEFIP